MRKVLKFVISVHDGDVKETLQNYEVIKDTPKTLVIKNLDKEYAGEDVIKKAEMLRCSNGIWRLSMDWSHFETYMAEEDKDKGIAVVRQACKEYFYAMKAKMLRIIKKMEPTVKDYPGKEESCI